MHDGRSSSRQRPHDAAYSSRAPSVARQQPRLCRPVRPEPPKTVAKWRKRTVTTDAPMGPKTPRSTVLTPAEEAVRGRVPTPDVAATRRRSGLPARHDPEPQPLRPVSLSATAQHLSPSSSRDGADAQAVSRSTRHLIPGPYTWSTVCFTTRSWCRSRERATGCVSTLTSCPSTRARRRSSPPHPLPSAAAVRPCGANPIPSQGDRQRGDCCFGGSEDDAPGVDTCRSRRRAPFIRSATPRLPPPSQKGAPRRL